MQSKEQAFFFDAIRKGELTDVQKVIELFPELLNAPDERGFTPLIIAAYSDQPLIVEWLVKSGADLNAGDAAGNTALMGACFKGYYEIAKLLVAAGADVNARNLQGAPALTFAATFGQMDIARLLLENGATTTFPDNRGKTSFDHAVLQENEEMIDLLSKYTTAN